MRTLDSFLRGHIDGRHADVEHILRGRFRHELDDDERARVAVHDQVAAVLEQIARERVAELNSHYGAQLIEECGVAYQAGVVQGLALAVRRVDARLWALPAAVFDTRRQNELRRLRAGLARLRDHHGRPAPRPTG